MERFFRKILEHRTAVLAAYLLLLIPAVYLAVQVETDNSLDRLIVPSDPGKKDFEHFLEIFGSDEFVLIALEGKDIYGKRFLSETDEIERRMQSVPHLASTRSLISVFREVNPVFNPADENSREAFRAFALSTPFFHNQGLIAPDRILTIVLQLKIGNPAERREVVRAVNDALQPFRDKADSPYRSIRIVGQPHLNYELDYSSTEIGMKFFPIYLLFAMGLVWFLYRSLRGVLAVLVSLAVCLAFAVSFVQAFGSVLTMISSVMPMMVMIVTIETMIHIYSGYVRQPEGVSRREHLIHVLVQKRKACWYSVLTTAIGFGSFAVSPVLPVKELGLFVALSIVVAYVVCFTLFPVLLDLLNPATGQDVQTAGLQVFDPLLSGIPTYTYWWRKSIVPVMTLVAAVGIHGFFGMKVETNTLEYLDEDNELRKNTVFIENNLMGLMSLEVVLEGKEGQFSSPESLRLLQELEKEIDADSHVQNLLSSSSLLRLANFLENGEDRFPDSNFTVSKYIVALSQQDMWSKFISDKFDKLRISVIISSQDRDDILEMLKASIRRSFAGFQEKHPEFKDVTLMLTGYAPLASTIGDYLLQTLMSSFVLTLAVIFFIFWLNIRRFTYAVLAMLPSIFAIILMYACMTLAGVKLSITSIIIAACVLGISVDSTIHFFQHYMEKLKSGSTLEEALQYSLVVTGRAIIVSNIVMFAGFMTFAFSSFPSIKHFGLLTSIAMVFSLFGTLIYLPACLWLMSPKARPAHLENHNGDRFRILPPPPPPAGNIE